jgi:DNA-binding winged helix-turn-helix (wHTH) protein
MLFGLTVTLRRVTLRKNIFVLRRALGDEKTDHKYIVTIPGTGYRFVASVNERYMPEAWRLPERGLRNCRRYEDRLINRRTAIQIVRR